MCEAVTVGAIVAGTAVSMYGQYQQGKTQGQIAKNNAQVARWQARDAVQRGAYDARTIENQGRAAANSARVALEANGIDSTVGSGATQLTTSAINASVDATRAKANAARAAWGFRAQAADSIAQGNMARSAGALGALGTGLSGAGSAGMAYASYRK